MANKRTVQLKKEVDSPTVEIADGSYKRVFNRDEQHFAVTEEEWKLLARTGLFEPATAVKKKTQPPTSAETETSGQPKK